jgi:polysaccharide biosynthesis/export protein
MLKLNRLNQFVAIFTTFLIFSCTSKKKYIYFQGGISNTTETNKNYTPVFRTDDFLSVVVTGPDLEAVKPFNQPILVTNNNLGGYTTGNHSPQGYLVDATGNIDFPVIGKIKVAGLDRMKVTQLLQDSLLRYLKSPIVNVRILNFKVTVLGEVNNPGTFNIPNERITLLEALGLAGDLNINGVRKNVLVIRDVDGKKTETRIDLTTNEVFSSPVFYLNQNDVVYVEPNRAKINSSIINPANAGIFISSVSLLVTLVAIFFN